MTNHFCGIDTGCVFDGKLCALEWPSKHVFVQANIELIENDGNKE